MEEPLNYLIGKPQHNAIKALGYPDKEYTLADVKVWEWGTHQNYSYSMPTQNTAVNYHSDGTFSTTTSYGSTNYSGTKQCKMRIFINPQTNNVKYWDWEGNTGCQDYYERLKDYWRSVDKGA